MKLNKYIASLSVLAIFGGVFAFSINKAEAACLPTDAPSITITSPNGGEVYNAGKQIAVKWTSCNIPASEKINIDLEYTSTNGWAAYNIVALNTGSATFTLPTVQPTSSSFPLVAPLASGKYYKIRVVADTKSPYLYPYNYDESDNLFTINPELIKLTSPNSGQFAQGDNVNITWTGGNPTGKIRISLISVSPFKVQTVLTDTAPNTGSYTWTIPNNIPDNTYEFYVQSDRGLPGSTWMYGGKITIKSCMPSVIVTSNNVTVNAGQLINITWSSTCFASSDLMKINLWHTNSNQFDLTLATPNDGSEGFSIPTGLMVGGAIISVSSVNGYHNLPVMEKDGQYNFPNTTGIGSTATVADITKNGARISNSYYLYNGMNPATPVSPNGSVRVIYSTDSNFSTSSLAFLMLGIATDSGCSTACYQSFGNMFVDLTNLTANTNYYYKYQMVDNSLNVLSETPIASFTTLP